MVWLQASGVKLQAHLALGVRLKQTCRPEGRPTRCDRRRSWLGVPLVGISPTSRVKLQASSPLSPRRPTPDFQPPSQNQKCPLIGEFHSQRSTLLQHNKPHTVHVHNFILSSFYLFRPAIGHFFRTRKDCIWCSIFIKADK